MLQPFLPSSSNKHRSPWLNLHAVGHQMRLGPPKRHCRGEGEKPPELQKVCEERGTMSRGPPHRALTPKGTSESKADHRGQRHLHEKPPKARPEDSWSRVGRRETPLPCSLAHNAHHLHRTKGQLGWTCGDAFGS